jgi:hypothetical protein
MNYSKVKNFFFIVFAAVFLLPACSYTVMPGKVPLVPGEDKVSLSAVSAIIMNGEKNEGEYRIFAEDGGKTGLTANRQAWSKVAVESIARELARRQARVRGGAPILVSVEIPQITFSERDGRSRLNVVVLLTTTTGWSKKFEGIAETNDLRSTAHIDRLAAEALSDAVSIMMSDAGFLAHLTKK